jgi:regulation of enolase protein 1 (concanavalin A-like superfamily)
LLSGGRFQSESAASPRPPPRRSTNVDRFYSFWQTQYGIQLDHGHFLYCEMSGDFVLKSRVVFHPVHQLDQAGIMVRVSSD